MTAKRQRPGSRLRADDLGDVLDAGQVARYLGISASTVEDYGRRGILPSVKLGRHRRFLRADVLAHLEALRTA